MAEKIPSALLVKIPNIMGGDSYPMITHPIIRDFFSSYIFSDFIPVGFNKIRTIRACLISVNQQCAEPLSVLGEFLIYVMENDGDVGNAKEQINQALADAGLSYQKGGNILKQYVMGVSLWQQIKQRGSQAVSAEVERAEQEVDSDSMSAAHRAATLLEACFKVYCESAGIPFKESEQMGEFWNKVAEDIKIRPKDFSDDNLKQIASGLYSIVNGTRGYRNEKTAAHGKSEQALQKIKAMLRPRHARLVIHAAAALCAYILECQPKKFC